MSTNFYIREASVSVETGKRVFEDTHIGKRSGGWTFNFNAREHRTVEEWRQRLANLPTNARIIDEYNAPYTPEEFWREVEETKQPWGIRGMMPQTLRPSIRGDNPARRWLDEGYGFSNYEFC